MSNQQNDVCHDRMPAEPTRRQVLIAGASLITAPLVRGLTAAAKQAQTTGAGAQALGRASEWVSYGADKASSKYSSLAQIGPQNFSRLRVAWTWRSAEEEVDRQGVTENDVIDFTPELRKEALAVLAKYNYGPLYTPPSLEKPTIQMPGYAGGASWAGAACDGETGIMCIPSITNPLAVTMMKSGSQSPAPYVGSPGPMETLQGVPLWKPPYGAHHGDRSQHRRAPVDGPDGRPGSSAVEAARSSAGRTSDSRSRAPDEDAADRRTEGTTQRAEGGPAVPPFGIHDPTLRAYDKGTGKVVGEVALPRNATAAPMTYMLKGQQYIVVATGGANLPPELIALRLP
jgi:quinoprotein glucose dehydrogenase